MNGLLRSPTKVQGLERQGGSVEKQVQKAQKRRAEDHLESGLRMRVQIQELGSLVFVACSCAMDHRSLFEVFDKAFLRRSTVPDLLDVDIEPVDEVHGYRAGQDDEAVCHPTAQ